VADTVERSQGGNPMTVLRGTLLDRAALAGVLENVCELHLPVLSVEVLDPPDGQNGAEQQTADQLAACWRYAGLHVQ